MPAQLLAAVLHATGSGVPEHWDDACGWLLRAARSGSTRAYTQLAVLLPPDHPDLDVVIELASSAKLPHPSRLPKKSLARFTSEIELPHRRPLPEVTWSRETPAMRLYPGALTPAECRYLATAGAPFLAPARVNDGGRGNQTDHSRSNKAAALGLVEADLVTCSLRKRLATAGQQPASHAEMISVLHYEVGQAYQAHHDFFDPNLPAHARATQRYGQRCATVLAWLNDGYEGGHTRFHRLRLELRGGPGDVLSFSNVTEDGAVNRQTLHEGTSPTEGQKWLASLWLRDRPTPGFGVSVDV